MTTRGTRGPRGSRGLGRGRGRGRGRKTTIVRKDVFGHFDKVYMLINIIVGVGKLCTWSRSLRAALASPKRAIHHYTSFAKRLSASKRTNSHT